MAFRECDLGPEDLETLRTKEALAGCLHDAAKPEEAIAIFQESLAILERDLGKEHQWTLVTRQNLAASLSNSRGSTWSAAEGAGVL